MKKLKIIRRLMRILCASGWIGVMVLATMSDANSIGFFQIVIFSVLFVFLGLVCGIAAAELTEIIKAKEQKLNGDYRHLGDGNHVA